MCRPRDGVQSAALVELLFGGIQFYLFVTQTLKPYITKYRWILFVWAETIAYGQVYVGVHYPLDIVVGAFLGCGIGYMVASFYNRRVATRYPLVLSYE